MSLPPSILIVDDAPANLQLLTSILEQEACRVRCARSGKRALEIVGLEPLDLIILDIKMPEMDGLEVCSRIKQDERLRDIPVIFISGLRDVEDKEKAFEAGGVDYLTKPFQEREVQLRVKTHVRLHRQSIELANNYRRLKELEALRENLTHLVVHDMKSPLQTVESQLKMLHLFDAESLPQAGKDYLAEASAVFSRLAGITSKVLLTNAPANQENKFHPLPHFSLRKNEVLQWLMQGKSNAQIAGLLHISKSTVAKHVADILKDLKVDNRAAAIVHAMEMCATAKKTV